MPANDLTLTEFGEFSILLVLIYSDAGGSSNGRTADSDSACRGSNPCPPANSQTFTFKNNSQGSSRYFQQVHVLSTGDKLLFGLTIIVIKRATF